MKHRRAAIALLWAIGFLVLPGTVPAQEGDEQDCLERVIKGGVLFENEKIETVISLIGADAEITITKTAKVQGTVTLNVPGDVKIQQLLDLICNSLGVTYLVREGCAITIMTQEEKDATNPPAKKERKRYQIRHRQATDLVKALESLLTENVGQMTVDPANNTITIYDTLEAHDRIQREIQNLDTPLKTIIMNLRYVSANEVAEALARILVGEPDIQINERLNQVILRDTISNILRAQLYVEQIDKDRDLRIYHINYAWEKFDEIAGLIEKFASEDAIIETWEERRLIIVEDIPARQERIQQLVQSIDLPTQQVLIEAEIVRVSNNLQFEFGSSYLYSSATLDTATQELSGLPIDQGWQALLGIPESGSITIFGLKDDSFQFQIRALESLGLAETVSSPRIVVRNDMDASLKVGTEEPYATRQRRIGTVSDSDTEYYSQRSREVGTLLEVTPHIMDNGYIEMDVFLEDSDAEQVLLEGANLDALRVFKRSAETRLLIRDGRTIAIGGLFERDSSQTRSGLPFLSRIPILGAPFRLNIKNDAKQKLVLFITPRVVSLDDPFGRRKDYDVAQYGAVSEIDRAVQDFFPEERKYEAGALELPAGATAALEWQGTREESLIVPLEQPEPGVIGVDLLDTVIEDGVDLDQDIHEVVQLIGKAFDVPIEADPALTGTFKHRVDHDITLRELLEAICVDLGAMYTVREGTIHLEPRSRDVRPVVPQVPEPAPVPEEVKADLPPAERTLATVVPGGIVADNEDVSKILAELFRKTKASVTKAKDLKGKATVDLRRDATVQEVLDAIGASLGCTYMAYESGLVTLMSEQQKAAELERLKPGPEVGTAPEAPPAAVPPLRRVLVGGVDFENVPLSEAAADLARRTGVPITMSREVRDNKVLVGVYEDVPLQQVLSKVAAAAGAKYVVGDDGAVEFLSAREWLEQRAPAKMARRRFVVANRPVEEVGAALEGMLTSGKGSIALDTANNALLVEDTVAVLARIEKRIAELDAPAGPVPEEPRAHKRTESEAESQDIEAEEP